MTPLLHDVVGGPCCGRTLDFYPQPPPRAYRFLVVPPNERSYTAVYALGDDGRYRYVGVEHHSTAPRSEA